jgi:hypothetical protein
MNPNIKKIVLLVTVVAIAITAYVVYQRRNGADLVTVW